MDIFDDTSCELGEGAFWHPERQSFLWFDILGRRLHERGPNGRHEWDMPELTSAMGWVGGNLMLLSSESGLVLFDLEKCQRVPLAAIDADNPGTRSNDGRADPWGGFWHSTMGKSAERGAGGIWRWHKGELRQLRDGLTIPNSICFDQPRKRAYFSDTSQQKLWVWAMDDAGWPLGEPRVFLDLSGDDLNPDGAVTDSEGRLWIAQWGAGRVACHDSDGGFVSSVNVGAKQTSCPVFGGPDLTALMVTSAWAGMDEADRAADPRAGYCFAVQTRATGIAPPRVLLS